MNQFSGDTSNSGLYTSTLPAPNPASKEGGATADKLSFLLSFFFFFFSADRTQKMEYSCHWTDFAPFPKPVYRATNQLKHRSRSYTTGIIELGLRSRELIRHSAAPRALSLTST